MLGHQGQISFPVTVEREQIHDSTVILYLLTYNAFDVTDDNIIATALSSQVSNPNSLVKAK